MSQMTRQRSDRLSFIDEGLRQLPKLSEDEARCVRTLNVHSNAISSLSGLEALPRLTSLNLSSNALESFDSGAEALRQLSLTALDFACNRIEDVRGLGDLPALTTLNLSFNRIRTIDGLASGSTLQSLRTLDLRGNRISSARGLRCIARLTALTTLSLQSADGSCANPICAGAEEYRSGVCGIASSLLETLDGRPVVERLEEQSAPPDDDSRGSGGAAAPPRSPPPLMPHFDRLANLRRSGGAAAAGARPRRGDGGGGLELDRRAKLALRLKALQREARRESEDMQRFLADQRGPEAAGAASSAPRRRRRGKAAAKAAGAAASDAAQVEVEERAAADRLEALQREIEGARAEHVASTAALDEHRVATDEAQRAHAEHAAQAHDAIAAARHEASLCEATVHAQRLAAAELERSHRDNADAAAAARSELLANRGLAQRHVVEIERLRAELSTAESVEEQRSEVIGVLSRTVTDNARSAQVLEGELAAAALARSALSGRAEAAEGELRVLRDRIGSAERARREIAERGAERTSALEMRAAELAATSQLAQYEREHATAAAAAAIEAQLTSADAVQRLTGELRQSRAARSALDAALRAQETAQSEAAQQQEQMVALHAQRSDTRVVRLEGAFEMAARQTAELRHALETSQRLERRKAEGEQLALAGARDIADLAESQRDKLHQLERRLADAATVQARRDAEMLAGAAAAETRAEAAALAMDAAKREQASAAKALRGELQRALAAGAAAEQQRSDLAAALDVRERSEKAALGMSAEDLRAEAERLRAERDAAQSEVAEITDRWRDERRRRRLAEEREEVSDAARAELEVLLDEASEVPPEQQRELDEAQRQLAAKTRAMEHVEKEVANMSALFESKQRVLEARHVAARAELEAAAQRERDAALQREAASAAAAAERERRLEAKAVAECDAVRGERAAVEAAAAASERRAAVAEDRLRSAEVEMRVVLEAADRERSDAKRKLKQLEDVFKEIRSS